VHVSKLTSGGFMPFLDYSSMFHTAVTVFYLGGVRKSDNARRFLNKKGTSKNKGQYRSGQTGTGNKTTKTFLFTYQHLLHFVTRIFSQKTKSA
jgi:hypothetical protein